ncbi:MAG: GNAT family N-acetyltransferase [Candidatus Lokiarchaeota archaeon]|nr:GNAT family N-acetyltransferase [Candidatus Lokiarchaeota archaeon]MCK4480918.1 GNAT family N-acetyltransferase [Candidatus Lokiarchaeota archaeon]
MSSNIKVFVASPEHIDDLRELTKHLVEGLGQKFDPKRFDWGIRRRLYDPLQRHGILLALDEDTDDCVGMIIAELRIDPFGLSEGAIKQFFLKEPYRKKGVGSLLLEKALEHLKKIKVEKIRVNIKEKAVEAAKLYEKMNFKKVYEVLELDLMKESKWNKE